MDTEEEDILAIYINLINMKNAFTTLSFLYETIARKKGIRNILLLQTNDKYKVAKRKPVLGHDSISISCILSYLERTLSQFIP